MRVRRLVGFGVLAALATYGVASSAPGTMTTIDQELHDAMLRESDPDGLSGRVALVVVDDRSLAELGQWPWRRDVLARLVDRLGEAGAAAIAIDLLFAEPDRPGGDAADDAARDRLTPRDEALVRAVGRSPVVLSHVFTFDGAAPRRQPCVLHPVPLAVVQSPGVAPVREGLFQPRGVLCSLAALGRAAGASGFLNASPDRDGVLRRLPLLLFHDGQVYPSLALAAVLRAERPRQLALASAPGGRLRLSLDDRVVPLDAQGSIGLRYPGPAGAFPRFAAADVLEGRVDAAAFRGRVVLVGATALGMRDAVATPFDPAYPGLEVHATAVEGILTGRVITVPAWHAGLALTGVLLAAMGVNLLVGWMGLLVGSLVSVAGVIALWAGAATVLASRGLFLSPVLPTLAVLLALSTLVVMRLRHERARADTEGQRQERTRHFAVQSLTSLMGTRDSATGRHARRTQEFARLLASRLAQHPQFRAYLTLPRIAAIAQLAPLHDIGKVGVSDAVLRKPGPLTEEEFAEIRKHPQLGFEALERAQLDAGLTGAADDELLAIAKDLVRTHHERWDGNGYPQGLRGEAIPIPGRLMAVVDAYDALVGHRVYRDALPHDEAVAAIRAGRGSRFDPVIVDAFLAVEAEFRRVASTLDYEGSGLPA